MTEALFEIYKKEVEIAGKKFQLRPLSGRYLGKLYFIAEKFSSLSDDKETEEERGKKFLKAMDEETTQQLFDVSFQMFIKSYPQENKEALEDFVSTHLIEILPVLLEINFNNKQKQ